MDNLINWINNEIMRNQVYHDHKENMAWVATAFYITGAITLGIRLNHLDDCYKLFASIVASIMTGLMILFVCWQFRQRDVAARRVRGLIKTAIGLFKNGFPESGWDVKVVEVKKEDKYLYPEFINENIKGKQLQKDDGWKSWAISLSAMCIAAIVFFFLVWY